MRQDEGRTERMQVRRQYKRRSDRKKTGLGLCMLDRIDAGQKG